MRDVFSFPKFLSVQFLIVLIDNSFAVEINFKFLQNLTKGWQEIQWNSQQPLVTNSWANAHAQNFAGFLWRIFTSEVPHFQKVSPYSPYLFRFSRSVPTFNEYHWPLWTKKLCSATLRNFLCFASLARHRDHFVRNCLHCKVVSITKLWILQVNGT